MFLSQFLTIALIHLLAVISPGPDFAMVTRNSLIYSRKSGIYTSLGLALGIMVHVTYCLLGIGLIISKSIILFNVMKYVGAGYLIYIGYKSLRSKPQKIEAVGKSVETLSESFKKPANNLSRIASIRSGFLTNVFNPKVTLFMLALFTQVIDPNTPKLIVAVYGLEMISMTFAWFAIVSVFFSNEKIKSRVTKYQHYIERVTGGVLIALGIKVALASRK